MSTPYLDIIHQAIRAIRERQYYAQYPEHPKAYGEEAPQKGQDAWQAALGKPFAGLLQDSPQQWIGEEASPYSGESLGITYPAWDAETLVQRAAKAGAIWRNCSVDERAAILVEALEGVKHRFFELAHATQHTTGQSFMMSFQASGPHANDRALEALATGYEELTRFPAALTWVKPMGKAELRLEKSWKAVPKGVAVVIGCSTFPTWNSVPGLFASMITGNPVLVKPHPKSVYPIALVVAEIQKALQEHGQPVDACQLAVDSSAALISKILCEHPLVKLIDYTGGSAFGNYVESLPGKTTFTEKAGINSVILDSCADLKSTVQNIAFSVSLYSGQMCTAPQNIFIPEGGIQTAEGHVAYADVVKAISAGIAFFGADPKMGPGTLGAIQNELTLARVQQAQNAGCNVLLSSQPVQHADYPAARSCSHVLLETDASQMQTYENEWFGPIVLIIKTKDTAQSVALAKGLAEKHGAITCLAFSTHEDTANHIIREMEEVFVPVSLNLGGMAFVNQHASFSDFHVTGGNPAGNASFTNPEYVNKRFVWVGHRVYKG